MSPQSYSNVLQMIGHTPLVAVTRLDTGPCELFLKLENQNPGGSIKDRVGLYLIEAAERDGRLQPGGTLIEATAGNTGLGPRAGGGAEGLSAAARHSRQDEPGEDLPPQGHGRGGGAHPLRRQQGPPGILPGRGRAPRARDAQLLLRQPVRQPRQSAGARGDHRARDLGADGAPARCRRLRRRAPAARSPACRAILRAYGAERRDGAGRSGGLGARRATPRPARCRSRARRLAGRGHRRGLHPAGRGLLARVRPTYTIPDAEAFQHLPRAAGARKASSRAPPPARCSRRPCATAGSRRSRSASSRFVCDSGNKYLSKVYNDYWMFDQGFLERERFGDLRDLIARRALGARRGHGEFHRAGDGRLPAHEALRRLAAAGDAGRPHRRHRRRGGHPARGVRQSRSTSTSR